MASTLYGVGDLFIKNLATTQVYRAGTLQGVTISFKGDQKDLFGRYRYPVATAMGQMAIEGKADYATFDGRLLAAMLGATVTTGRSKFKTEVLTINGSHQVQATDVTGFEDMGVLDANKNPMSYIATPVALGQYSVDAGGLYSFYTSEAGAVEVSHRYTTTSGYNAVGTNSTVTAQPHFLGIFDVEWDQGSGTTEEGTIEFYAISIPSLDLTFKNDDFAMENLTFKAGANASGNVFKWHYD